MNKKSFILHKDKRKAVENLPDDQAGLLLKAIFAYADGEIVELDGRAAGVLDCIKEQMDIDAAAYAARCEKNKQNGEMGGRPAKKTEKPKTDKDELFEKFWAAYPRKSAKAEARKAFQKISPQKLMTEILPDIEKRKKTEQWSESKYIPYPATYLRGERWNDEVQKQTRKSNYEQREVTDDDFKDLFLAL